MTRRVTHPLQKSVVNPRVRVSFRLGIPDPGDARLDTTGRRMVHPRVTPVCDRLAGDTFWLISERGRRADWLRNIEANPGVRVKVRSCTRSGCRPATAHIVDDHDPEERRQTLREGNLGRRLCLQASRAMATELLTVRVDRDPRRSHRRENPQPSRMGMNVEP